MHSINGSTTKKALSNLWRTPPQVINYLSVFHTFNLDAYASKQDALFPNYIDAEANAHTVEWGDYTNGKHVVAFCNPPYSQPNIKECLKKAIQTAECGGTVVVLIPNQLSKYWGDLVVGKANTVSAIIGRLSFIDPVLGTPVSGNAGGSVLLTYLPRDANRRYIQTRTEYVLLEDIMRHNDA